VEKGSEPPSEAKNGIASLDLEIAKLDALVKDEILEFPVEIISHFACQPDPSNIKRFLTPLRIGSVCKVWHIPYLLVDIEKFDLYLSPLNMKARETFMDSILKRCWSLKGVPSSSESANSWRSSSANAQDDVFACL
jgi:hypothetical protein